MRTAQHGILSGVCCCEQAAFNPHCSFSVPGMWTRQMQKDVTANGGYYSIKFWMKPLDNFLDSARQAQALILYQSLSPPVILQEIYFNELMGGLNVSFSFVLQGCALASSPNPARSLSSHRMTCVCTPTSHTYT